MGRSRVTCRTQTEPQQADGPSSNHPAAAHGLGNKGLCLPLPGRGWSNIHPSVRAGRALRCRLVQEDFKPRGKGLAQGQGATQREDLGAGGSGGGGVGGRRQQDPQGWLSPPASPGSLPKPAPAPLITSPISFPSEHSALPTRTYFPVSHPSESHKGSCLFPVSPVPKTLLDSQ